MFLPISYLSVSLGDICFFRRAKLWKRAHKSVAVKRMRKRAVPVHLSKDCCPSPPFRPSNLFQTPPKQAARCSPISDSNLQVSLPLCLVFPLSLCLSLPLYLKKDVLVSLRSGVPRMFNRASFCNRTCQRTHLACAKSTKERVRMPRMYLSFPLSLNDLFLSLVRPHP